MPKRSGLLRRIAKKEAAVEYVTKNWTQQYCVDIMLLAMIKLGWGKKRLMRLFAIYQALFVDHYDALTAATESSYLRSCIDRALKQALGDDMVPWGERYTDWPTEVEWI